MRVIDFHSHILPNIDDGSKNLETSLRMLTESKRQGVDLMIATPHFYAWQDHMSEFLNNRNNAFELVKQQMQQAEEPLPEILLGAEVAFFEGMGRAEQVEELTTQGTRLLLLEMPFRAWRKAEIEEIAYLIERRGFKVILAHLERYFSYGENKKLLKELLQLPLYVQFNAESLLSRHTRGKCLKMYKKGTAHLLGSDCHGIHKRVPNLRQGRDVLEKALGQEFLNKMDTFGENILGGSELEK